MTRRRLSSLALAVLLASTTIVAQPASVATAAPLPVLPVIAGGERHSLVLDGDGILWTFGENFSGQLGTTINNGNSNPNPTPTQVMTDVAAIAAGGYHSMALKNDGTLWTFGENQWGQLGTTANLGTTAANPVPTQVMSDVVAIAAGFAHSMALKSNGDLYTFGYNYNGELGHTANVGFFDPNPTPTKVREGVVAIDAGDFHSFALETNGDLFSFGWNLDGQLGRPANAGETDPNPLAGLVLTQVDAIAAGGAHGLAVRFDDTLWTWGWNQDGQLGRTENDDLNAVPMPVPGFTGADAVAAGFRHSLALKTDGTLWTFGFNLDGELGHNTNVGSVNANPSPTQVLIDVDEIAAGAHHSLAFTDSGELLTFGWNVHGQLGLATNSGTEAANPTPTSVIPPEFRPLVPGRLLDSRPGGSTVDGLFQGIGLQTGGSTTALQVTGRGGVAPVAAAVVLNVTVVAQAGGFVTAYPCGSPIPNASNLNYSSGNTIPNLVVSQIGVDGKVCLFTSANTHLIADVTGFYPILPTFEPVAPGRLLDTRPLGTTVDGLYQRIGSRPAGGILELQVTGRGGVDADAEAAVLNVTVTGPLGSGYVTVYPCGSPLPNASNVNFVAGSTIPNLVITKIGTGGKVCIFTSATTHLIADIAGSYPVGASYESLVPRRLMDSRNPGSPTVDGQFQGIGLRIAGSTTQLQVTNRGGVPANGGTAVLNVTVTAPTGAGFVTVYPCGSPQPNSSNLNYVVGSTIANLVVTKIGTGGKVCIFTSAGTHIIADVNGYYAA